MLKFYDFEVLLKGLSLVFIHGFIFNMYLIIQVKL
jgi:hypothetical protein